MVEVCICAAPADIDIAEAIASRLERTAELHVQVERISSPLNESWDLGLDSAGFLMLLSPDSVPGRSDRQTWGSLLDHLNQRTGPPMASVLVRDCRFPPILGRTNFFEWRSPDVLRRLQAWAVGLHPPVEPAGITAAPIPGAQPLPAYLWTLLVDGSGAATIRDVRVAQEFAHQAAPYFRDVIWAPMEGRSAEFVASEFEEALRARKHRVLVVLHGTEVELEEDPAAQGSVIVVPSVELEPGAHPSRLWRAMGTCVRGCFPLDLAVEISGGDGNVSELERADLVDCLDRGRGLYRLRRLPQADPDLRPIHAAAVAKRFRRWRDDLSGAARVAAEVEGALNWAAASDWPTACQLGRNAADYFRNTRQVGEAAAVLELLLEHAADRQDTEVERDLMSELSWIRNDIPLPLRTPHAEQLTLDLLL